MLSQVLLTGGKEERKARRGEGEELKNSQGDTKGVKTGAVVDEVGPRTSERAAMFIAGNIGYPMTAVLVIYSTSLKKKQQNDERNKRKRKNEEDTEI